MEGRKEILGLYLSESEGANFWLSVLTDLNNRGVKDILIACVDGLKGFPEAIKAIFPNDNSLLKLLFVGIKNAEKKWTMPVWNWSLTLSQLTIFFEARLDSELKI